jgi:hypothetical protein
MSFAFNPPSRSAAQHHQEGLSISPECPVSRRSEVLTAVSLLLLGLGFLVVSSLFITTLVI